MTQKFVGTKNRIVEARALFYNIQGSSLGMETDRGIL
jgi:hypothetical protein